MIDRQFRHRRSIVRIQSGDSRGTGFWIRGIDEQLYILTCTHVLRENTLIHLSFFKDNGTFGDESPVTAEIVAQIPVPEGDIALLRVDPDHIPLDAQALQLLDVTFHEPPPFYAFGFPDAFSVNGRQAQGSIIGHTTSNDLLPLLQLKTDIDMRQGFSGGPLVHADLGYVLGMVSDRERPETNAPEANFYALPAYFIAEKLSAHIKAQTLHPYKAWLASQYNDIVMNDEKGMRLSDIHVEPHYGIHESCVEKEEEPFKGQETKGSFYSQSASIHDIASQILEGRLNIQNKTKNPRLTILFGYPGQGKTSFTKRLAHDYIAQWPEKNIYFVRLRYIVDALELRNNPFVCLEKEIGRQVEHAFDEKIKPEVDLRNALLILDGLDELYIKNGMNNQDIDEICGELGRNAGQYPGLHIILTSRYGYVNIEKLYHRNILILQLAELTVEQQKEWLRNYRYFHPESHLDIVKLDEYNQNSKFKALKELITQPILLHMIASLEQDISDAVNRAAIYTKLFDQLVRRPWSNEGNIEALRGINAQTLREALQDMAHAVFHAEKGYLYKSELNKLPKVEEMNRTLGYRLDDWRTVMVAFYTGEVPKVDERENENDRDFDYGIEFLHKSLPEYLCAEKIWRSILEKFLVGKPQEGEHALKYLYEIFGAKVISQEIVRYLIEIIQNDTHTNKSQLFGRLAQFLGYFTSRDFLPSNEKSPPLDTIIANFYGYWTVVSALNQKINLFRSEYKDHLTKYLKLLVHNPTMSYCDLSYQDLSSIFLQGANLQSANFMGANLMNANLQSTYLAGADLQRSILVSAILQGANLMGAKLMGAKLVGAILRNTILVEAEMVGTVFGNAKLEGAILEGANLKGAYLEGAYLQGAILHRANLCDVNLERANLTRTDLKRAYMMGVNLRQADLMGAYLHDAILQNADLQNAKLDRTYLAGAYLENANLEGAKLVGASLQGANLKKANVQEADFQGVILNDAKNITISQLRTTKTLFGCKGIPPEIESELRQTHPLLFEDPTPQKS